MKYIIDVSDEAIELMGGHISIFVEPVFKTGDCKHYALRLSKEDIKPYTEPDRKVIEDEVWEFAKKVRLEDFIDEEGRLRGYISGFDSYSEAKAKYEAWLKQKDEICAGDESKDDENIRAVVLDIRDEDYMSYEVFTENGIVDEWQKGIVIKTGRHFPEVTELLKKMREERHEYQS